MPVLRQGDVVEGGEGLGWEVVKRIGEGQFSEVYQVQDMRTQEQRALKIEKRAEVRTVRQEWKVLKRLQATCRQTVRVFEGGEHPWPGGRYYMVMELLGPNLTAVRRAQLGGQAELIAAKVVGAGMLKALEQVHAEGYIHRDVKPANFVMSPPDVEDPLKACWTLVDFGLAKPWLDERSGAPLPQRATAAFRGSTTYASTNCHQLQDQSRRDDLWGWFYCLVELVEGTLPWRGDREAAPAATNTGGESQGGAAQLPSPPQDGAGAGLSKEAVLQRKLECLEAPQLLITSMPCPQAICQLSQYLQELGFEDAPNYAYLRSVLNTLDGGAVAPPLPPKPARAPAARPAEALAETRPVVAEAAAQEADELSYGLDLELSGGYGGGSQPPSGGGSPAPPAERQQSRQEREDVAPQHLSRQRSRSREARRDTARSRSREGRGGRDARRDARSHSRERGGRKARSRSRSKERRGGREARTRSRSKERRGGREARSRSRSKERRGGREARSRSKERRDGHSRSRSRSRNRRSAKDAVGTRSRSRDRERRDGRESREARSRSRSKGRRDARSRSHDWERGRERERPVSGAGSGAGGSGKGRSRSRERSREREQEEREAKRPRRRSSSRDGGSRRSRSRSHERPGRRDEARRDSKVEEARRDEGRRDEGRLHSRQDEAQRDAKDTRRDSRQDEARRDSKQDEGRRDSKQDEGRREEPRRDGARRDDTARRAGVDSRADRRSRSRSPRGSKPQQRQEGGAAGNHPKEHAGRSQQHSREPQPGRDQQPRGAAEPAAGGEAGGIGSAEGQHASPQPYSTDQHIKYRSLLDAVFALRQGGMSEPAVAAAHQLRALQPQEAAGVLCWVLDELASATEARHLPAVAAFCDELAAFAAGTAKRCLERSRGHR